MAAKRKPGRPRKKVIDSFVDKAPETVEQTPAVEEDPVHVIVSGCVECGKPVAKGQTYVCAEHVRRS